MSGVLSPFRTVFESRGARAPVFAGFLVLPCYFFLSTLSLWRVASMAINEPLNRKLRMALVGGGQGAFIGRVHATAAIMDNRAVLVAGALSSDPQKSRASAADYDIKPERAYGSFAEMIAGESKLPPGERIDFVS